MKWHEPRLNSLTGVYMVKIEGVNVQNLDNLYHHPLNDGGFLNYHSGKAEIPLNPNLVKRHGVRRCYQWLREDILEVNEAVAWNFTLEFACRAALEVL